MQFGNTKEVRAVVRKVFAETGQFCNTTYTDSRIDTRGRDTGPRYLSWKYHEVPGYSRISREDMAGKINAALAEARLTNRAKAGGRFMDIRITSYME
jgi:hypothetical protein